MSGASRQLLRRGLSARRARSPFAFGFIIVSLLVVAVFLALRVPDTREFAARGGVLDLRGYDLDHRPAVDFGGEWAFFWGKTLDPQVFSSPTPPVADALLTAPGSWRKLRVNGGEIGGNGYATLHLRILAGAADVEQAVRVAPVYSAYRLWANGRLIAESGRVGDQAGREVMDHSLRIAALPMTGEPIDLVMHVSCFSVEKAYIPTLQLGRSADLNAIQNRIWGIALFSAGTVLLMGLYHLALFALYPPSRVPLYFGLYCLVWMGVIVSNATSDWAIRVFFPLLEGETLYRVSMGCYGLTAPFSYLVFRSLYPREFPRWLLVVFSAIGGAYAATAVFGPTHLSSMLMPAFHLVIGIKSFYFLWALSRAVKHHRTGALIILAGYVVATLLSFNDLLVSLNLIRNHRLMYLGMLFLMLTQALALAQRFTGLIYKNEKLSVRLAERNKTLEKEIARRTRLQQEVVSISEDERRRISHRLHDGLCQQLTGARLQSTALEGAWPDESVRAKAQASLSGLLEEAVTHAYELSRGLWSMGPESEDVCTSLRQLAKRQTENGGVPVRALLSPACASCASNNAVQMYCIAREAVANATRHAQASEIVVSLDCLHGGFVNLTIIDDGVGCKAAARSRGGLGLKIMAYRAQMVGGSLKIEDGEAGGTRVVCSIPCKPQGMPLSEWPASRSE